MDESQAENKKYILIRDLAPRTPYTQGYLSLLARRGKVDAIKIGKSWHINQKSLEAYMATTDSPASVEAEKILYRSAEPRAELASLSASAQAALYPAQFIPVADPKAIESEPTTKEVPATRVTEKGVEPAQVDSLADALDRHFKSRGRFSRFNYFAKKTVVIPWAATAVLVTTLTILFLFVDGFSFGKVDAMAHRIKQAVEDAQTLQGYMPGTHANEVLLLDDEGKISIYGHIETQGQIRSLAGDGVAPLVVDSTVTVENLSADYVDGFSHEEFTLAFVTERGNVTTDRVFLNGGANVGGTLEVSGATKLLSYLEVYGELHALSDAVVDGALTVNDDITVGGDASFLNSVVIDGAAEVKKNFTALSVVVKRSLTVEESAYIEGDFGVGGDTSIADLDADDGDFSGDIEANDANFSGSLTVGGNATFNGVTLSGSGTSTFSGNLSVAGDGYYGGDVQIIGNLDVGSLNLSDLTVTGTSTSRRFLATDLGGETAAAYSFSGDLDTGIFSAGPDILNFTTAGVTRFTIDASGNVQFTGTGTSTYAGNLDLAGDFNATRYDITGTGTSTNAGNLAVEGDGYFGGNVQIIGNLDVGTLNLSDLTVTGTSTARRFLASDLGNATAAAYSFSGDLDTGIFSVGADTLNFTTGGTNRFTIDSSGNVAFTGTGTSTFAGSVDLAGDFNASNFYTTGVSTSTMAGNLDLAGDFNATRFDITGTGATSTLAGHLYSTGNVEAIGDLFVIGDSIADTVYINSYIQSNLVPFPNATYDLGTAARYWNTLYVDTINANTIAAASTSISGTINEDFTINSDNATADLEDMSLIFYRGTVVPNAVITWDSSDDHFDFNHPVVIQNDSTLSLATNASLVVRGQINQTADIFQVASTTGDILLNVTSDNRVGVATSTPGATLAVDGDALITGNLNLGGTLTAAGDVTFTGLSTFSDLRAATLNSTTTNIGTLTTFGGATIGTTLTATGGLSTLSDLRAATLNASSTSVGTLTGYGLAVLPDLRASVLNASTTLLTNATTTSLAISGITGSTQCLQVDTNGTVTGAGTQCASGAAWEQLFTNAITPTSTTAGIFVNASSTFDSTLRVNGNTELNGILTVTNTATSSIAGGLTVDTDTLVVDKENNRVGIGTNAPTSLLHLVTTSAHNSLHVEANTSGSSSLRLNSSNNAASFIQFEDNENCAFTLKSTPTTGELALIDGCEGGTQFLRIEDGIAADSFYFRDTGALGIATTTPGGTYGEKLTVVGGAHITGGATTTSLAITGITGSTQCLQADTNGVVTGSGVTCEASEWLDAGSYVYPDDGDYAAFPYFTATSTTATSTIAYSLEIDTDTFVVNANEDQVGINISNPDAYLEIRGATQEDLLRLSNSTTNYANFEITSQGDWDDDFNLTVAGGAGSAVYTFADNRRFGVGAGMPDATIEVVPNGTNDPFYVSSAQDTLGDLFNVQNGGQVGIATTTPGGTYGEKITVVGSAYITDDLYLGGEFFVAGTGTSTIAGGLTVDTDTLVVNDNENRVGIGTASPAELVHIYGSPLVRLERSDNANSNMIYFQPAGALSSSNVAWYTGMATNANDYRIRSWSGAVAVDRFLIDNSGDVRIPDLNASTTLVGTLTATGLSILPDLRSASLNATSATIDSLTINTSLTNTGTTTARRFLASDLGNPTAAAFSFSGDLDTGIYSSGANSLNLTSGGVLGLTLDSSQDVTLANELFVSGTGTSTIAGGLVVDTNTLVVNDNEGRVYVGTTTPSQTAKFGIWAATENEPALYIQSSDNGDGSPLILIERNQGGQGRVFELVLDSIGRNPTLELGDTQSAANTEFYIDAGGGNDGIIGFRVANESTRWTIRRDGSSGPVGNADDLVFSRTTDGSTFHNVMTLANANTFVGIGTTTPDTTLSVVSVANTHTPLSVSGFSNDQSANLFEIGKFSTSTPSIVYTASENLGVGTTTPVGKLSIDFSAASQPGLLILASDRDTTNPLLSVDDTSGTNPLFQVISDQGVGINSNPEDNLPSGFDDANDSAVALQIRPYSRDAGIFIRNTTASDGLDLWMNTTGTDAGSVFIDHRGTDTAQGIHFRGGTSGTPVETFFIRGTGAVGVGTTTPGGYFSEKFTVVGGAYITGGATTTSLAVAGITGSTQCLQADTNGTVTGTGSACGAGGGGAAWELLFTDALTPTSTTAGIFVNASSTFDSTLRVNGIFTNTTVATSSFAGGLTVDTTTLVVNDNENRVGINTASPKGTLHVDGDVAIGGLTGLNNKVGILDTSASAATLALYNSNSSASYIGIDIRDGSNSRFEIGFSNSTDQAFIYTLFSDPILFYTANTDRGRIDANGDWGIATSTPGGTYGEKLTVVGAGYITDDLYSDGEIFISGTGTSTIAGGLTVDTTTLVVNDNENRVGIGTSTPNYLFTVNGTDATTNLFQVATTTNQGVFIIDSDGDVGIGTDDASYELEIRRQELTGVTNFLGLTSPDVAHGLTSIASTDAFGEFEMASAGGGLRIGGLSDAASSEGLTLRGVIGNTNPNDATAGVQVIGAKKNGTDITALGSRETVFNVLNNSSVLSVILGDGSFGIGTTTPGGTFGEKLTVVGSTYITGGATTTNLAIAGITGSTQCLQADTNGTVTGTGSGCGGSSGSPGAWETLFTNALTPTSTTAGIFVNASSTFDSTLRVNGIFSNTTSATSSFAGGLTVGTDFFVINENEERVSIGFDDPFYPLDIRQDFTNPTRGTQLNILPTITFTANGSYPTSGISSYLLTGGSGNNTSDMIGVEGWVDHEGSGALTGDVFGVAGTIALGDGDITTAHAIKGLISFFGGSGDIITTAYGGHFDIDDSGAGSITTGYGVYIDDIAATTDYGLFQNGPDDNNYFAGLTGISTTTAGGYFGERLTVGGTGGAFFTRSSGGTEDLFRVGTSTDLNIFSVKSTGRVGVGTSNPTANFHVVTDDGGDDFILDSTIGNPDFHLSMAGTSIAELRYDATLGAFTIRVDPTGTGTGDEKFAIGTNGSVGIATTSPGGYFGEKLTVVGSTYITGGATTTNLAIAGITGSTQCLQADTNGTVTGTGSGCGGGSSKWTDLGTQIYPNDGDSVAFPFFAATSTTASSTIAHSLTIDTSTLYVNANENEVGIGTTTPSEAKLTIQGGATGNGLLIAAGETDFVDYIFRATDQDQSIAGFIVEASGNVGIATTTAGRYYGSIDGPHLTIGEGSGALIIRETGGLESLLRVGTSTDDDLFLVNSRGNVTVGGSLTVSTLTATSSVAYSFTAENSLLFVNANENRVGIGTSTPQYGFVADSTVELGRAGLGHIQFVTTTQGGTPTLIGIGTSTPDADLTLVSDQTAVDTYLLTVATSSGSSINRRFTVDSDGDIRYDGSASAGADYAEAFTVEGLKENYEPGDIMSLSLDDPGKVTKSSSPYDEHVVGVHSTKPGIIGTLAPDVTDYDMDKTNDIPVGILGRVPVKVSTENGPIAVGDKITTSSLLGVGMRADSNGMVVGRALESYDGVGVAKIMVMVEPMWYSGNLAQLMESQQATTTVADESNEEEETDDQTNIPTIVETVGEAMVNLWDVTRESLTTLADSLWNVTNTVIASTSKLRIFGEDENGLTYETYSVQSARREITLSGTAALERLSGEDVVGARVAFDESFMAVIDENAPLKVVVTPTSRISGSLYVHEKHFYGFEIREQNGESEDSTFDWIVVARLKGDYSEEEDPVVSGTQVDELPQVEETEETAAEESTDTGAGETATSTPEVIEEEQITTDPATPLPVEELLPEVSSEPHLTPPSEETEPAADPEPTTEPEPAAEPTSEPVSEPALESQA